ncbi:MAG TPA: PKD domain-containing protein [Dissulfurispiraceae bacterium]|nr:PKD domain-containing protein [Dissulfurispiraceae bacterium]
MNSGTITGQSSPGINRFTRMAFSFLLRCSFAAVFALSFLLLFAGAVYAATLTVNTTSDSHTCGSPCSLRGAIEAANTAGGTSTINLPAGTYNLSLGELQVGTSAGTNITISGAGSANTIIQQPTQSASCAGPPNTCVRVLNLDPNGVGNIAVTISNVQITRGYGDALGGGGILGGWTGDSLTIDNCVITGNSTTNGNNGGGISWSGGGNLTIQNSSTISNNTANQAVGGGIAFNNGSGNAGNLSISNSTITGNTANAGTSTGTGAGQGGGLFLSLNSGSTATITNSTFTSNSALLYDAIDPGLGGGIYHASGALTITGSTFGSNTATTTVIDGFGKGGAIYSDTGALSVTGGTITGNTAASGGGVYRLDSAAATATANWWGCNPGPNNFGCDRIAGNVTVSPNTTKPPDLTIAKTHSGNFIHGQTGAQYTITVSNQSSTNSTWYETVTVTDTLPSSLTATAISGTGWACTLATLTCTRNDVLGISSSYPPITVTVNVAVDSPTSITNSATVTDTYDSNSGNNTATDPTTINVVLTVTKDRTGTGSGDVSVSPGTLSWIGNVGTAVYVPTTPVILTENPGTDSGFIAWGGACSGNGTTCNQTMNSDISVTVKFNLKADFSGTPTSGQAPLRVQFSDLSIAPVSSWLWDFGDGSTSTSQSPAHLYLVPAGYPTSYTVSLTSNGSTTTKNNYITLTAACANGPVMIGAAPYASIQNAFDTGFSGGEVIKVLAVDRTETLTWHQPVAVKLQGGFDCTFTDNPGFTTVHGAPTGLTINSSGTSLTIDNLVIK